jgi:hypothetical protein
MNEPEFDDEPQSLWNARLCACILASEVRIPSWMGLGGFGEAVLR